MKDAKILAGVKLILQGLEVDVTDRNYIKTPWRVLDFYKELFADGRKHPSAFEEQYNEMIVMRHHKAWALCPHHLLPVKLDISVAYIPDGAVLGLSKLVRLAQACLTKPAMQEEITHWIADTLMNDVQPRPLGTACMVQGEHLCMKMRGVKTESDIVTSAVRGVFLEKPEARAEFLSLVR